MIEHVPINILFLKLTGFPSQTRCFAQDFLAMLRWNGSNDVEHIADGVCSRINSALFSENDVMYDCFHAVLFPGASVLVTSDYSDKVHLFQYRIPD